MESWSTYIRTLQNTIMEENDIALYGFKPDYDPLYDEPIELGEFPTYEEAKAMGEKLIAEGKIIKFDTYVIWKKGTLKMDRKAAWKKGTKKNKKI